MKTVYTKLGTEGKTRKPVIIFDLDGTLSNDSGRSKWIRDARTCLRYHQIGDKSFVGESDWKEQAQINFHDYHSRCKQDSSNLEVLLIAKAFLESKDYEVWVLTARPERYAVETIEWLFQKFNQFNHRLFPDRIIMREDEEMGGSPAIKKKFILENIPSEFHDDSAIFDDDERVIAAMRGHTQTMLYKQIEGI